MNIPYCFFSLFRPFRRAWHFYCLNLLLRKTHGSFSCKSSNLLKFHLTEIVLFLLVLTRRCVNSLSYAQQIRFMHQSLLNDLYFISVVSHIHHVWLYSIAIKRSDYFVENPGLKSYYCGSLSICHWNLNSITACSFIKLYLCAYISIGKFDI